MTTLHLGDCLDVLRTIPSQSIDAVVTDPPYGLSFMGKKWDYDVPSVEIWQECLRVLKSGGHLLAFAGTRTQHRMAVRIEDAGFDIRDMIAWVYGSGFPKSLDVSKAIDKAAGAEREVVGQETKARSTSGASALPTVGGETVYRSWNITAPATDAAKQWQGWGTALKPALEPITVARKPITGTVAENVLKHGTGAINVEACRVAFMSDDDKQAAAAAAMRGAADQNAGRNAYGKFNNGAATVEPYLSKMDAGRWPANFIHDGSKEATRLLGDAHRFFYSAKAGNEERTDDNNHPTVKPTDLMRYLCRLVTPPNGIVLDPFMGSGSTGVAAILEGFRFVGIEREPHYHQIATKRIDRATAKPKQSRLF